MKVPTSSAAVAPMARAMISINTAWSSPICMPAARPVRSRVTSCSATWTSSGPLEWAEAYSTTARRR